MVHLDGLDFGGHVGRSEGDDHAALDNTSLNTTDGHLRVRCLTRLDERDGKLCPPFVWTVG